MPIYSLNGITPVIEPGAFVHPQAVLIGDVFVLEGAFIAPFATMRGDFGRLILGKGANLQEHCCMHGFSDTDTIVEEDGHIGHGAILHGCHIKKNALIGMNSVILDYAVIGENSIIGANSLVTTNTHIDANTLSVGNPAKVKRALTEEEIRWKTKGTQQYHMLAHVYPDKLTETTALTKVNFDRPRLSLSNHTHNSNHKN